MSTNNGENRPKKIDEALGSLLYIKSLCHNSEKNFRSTQESSQ